MAFTFIRHGETVNNRKGLYQGWSDPSLLVTEKCRLRSVRDHYPNPCFIITSDLKRCVETATTLFPEKRVFNDPGFRELNFGDFEEKSYEQLKDVPAYRTWLAQPFHERPPNGESFQTFTDRLQKSWNKWLDYIHQNREITEVVIVTHGGVIRTFLMNLSIEKKPFWEWDIRYGNGYHCVATIDQLRRDEACISFLEVPLTESRDG